MLEQFVILSSSVKTLENRFIRKEKKSGDNMQDLLSYLIEMNTNSIQKLDGVVHDVE